MVLAVALLSLVFRSACWLYNRLAGTPPRPVDFGQPWIVAEMPAQTYKTTDAGAYTAPSIVEDSPPGLSPVLGRGPGHPLLPMVPDPDGVPEPESGHALGICFMIGITNIAIHLTFIPLLAMAADAGANGFVPITIYFAQWPIVLLAQVALIAAMLPTTFVRALCVVALQIPVVLFVILGVYAMVALIGLATGARVFW